MQSVLVDLETRLARRPREVADVLGVCYGHYCAMRAGKRAIPRYTTLHAELLLRVPDALLNAIIRERLIHE